jgi:hypothetical protein
MLGNGSLNTPPSKWMLLSVWSVSSGYKEVFGSLEKYGIVVEK